MDTTRFNTPIIWVPNLQGEELQAEIDDMFFRAYATQKWLNNELETDTLLDILDSQKIDVYDLVSVWESGVTL
jgi:hypothetical protein